MEKVVQKNIELAQTWLTEHVFPIWFEKGFDHNTGCFIESFSSRAEPMYQADRRAMVQARQIYSLVEAVNLNLFGKEKAKGIIKKNISFLKQKYSLPSGAFTHSVNSDLKISNADVDLYTQAFILFGLAKAYEILREEDLKLTAKTLLNYLKKERALKNGGYTEIKGAQTLYQSNPHMHLFEAALAWMAVDHESCWKDLAEELKELCLSSFIDAKSQALAEHYSQPWTAIREEGQFIFEPGHHYEWAWLLLQYEQLTKTPVRTYAESLFLKAEEHGVNKNFVVDEVLSNYQVKKASSRFWPQCERIKAASVLGKTKEADQAFETLFKYFEVPTKGLWQDTLLADGSFQNQPAKASSLYHIINALSEYILKRSKFK